MKNIFHIILVLVSTTILFAQNRAPNYSKDMQEYFMDPKYSNLCKIMKLYDEDEEIKNNPSRQMPIMGYFCVAFSNIKIDSVDLREQISNKYSKNELIQQCYEMSQDIETILTIDKHEAGMNDFYWGAFFASGEQKYIERIASELKYVKEKDFLMLYLAGSSAKWSLCSNSKQYPLVKKHLLVIREKETDDVREQIDLLLKMEPGAVKEEMINDVKEYKKKMVK